MGLRLVPVCDRIKIIRTMIPMAMLDRHLDRFLKGDRALRMPPIQAIPPPQPLIARDVRRPIVPKANGLLLKSHAPL